MKDISDANLPFDIQLEILKKYIRSWSTRIPKWGEPLEYFPQKNRAALIYISSSRREYGWHAIPISPWNQVMWRRFETDPTYYSRQYRESSKHRSPRPTEEIQISRILAVGSSSKAYLGPLATFFFGHMVWEFRAPD